jgi:hypothetical protein
LSSFLYFIADLYPWWAIPLAFIFADLGNRQRKRRARGKMFFHFGICATLVLLAVAYFVFNGKENLTTGMQNIERTMRDK